MKPILKEYIKEIHNSFSRGDAREESYYNILERLILNASEKLEKTGIHVTINPKKSEGGNPDFRVWDGRSKIAGYIEAKKPGTNLDDIENSEQLKRYRETFPNLILTNFLEFRLYREGRFIESVSIGRQHTLVSIGAKPAVENEDKFAAIFAKYFAFTFPCNLNAVRLAKELAKRTRFLRDQVIIEELKGKAEDIPNHILGFYEAFKKYLIYGLTEKGFADLYSQTVTYGLFAARTRCQDEFTRKNAVDFIPRSIGILHDVFQFISSCKPSKQLEWIIDDITEVLTSVNVNLILNEFYHEGKGEDPVVHFYETFLSEYDPKLREKRGVYYTPQAVVSFIVRSLNIILKEHFAKPDGLADLNVKILDPAAGTLTFIAEAAKVALDEYVKKYGAGVKEDFIYNHLLKNFYAFELMMAPYAIGHLKMSYIFEEMGVTLKDEDRFKLYLTNTLEMQDIEQSNLPGMSTLSEESRLAGKVKKQTPILVILGNPPYSGISSNPSEKFITKTSKNKKERKVKVKTWIGEKIEDYKYVDGEHFRERKHWLQDDYVKFIRFAQWKIDQNGEGVLGFITNHSYLDNITFRGMRQSLMDSFDKIYILDLHGSEKKREKCPEGINDENVFDIEQGVAVALFIKLKGKKTNSQIFHADLWGDREKKYKWLIENNYKTTNYKSIIPNRPYYFFVLKEKKWKERYDNFIGIPKIFSNNGTGVISARDHFVIDIDLEKLKKRIIMFKNSSFKDEFIRDNFKLNDTRGWKLIDSRISLANDEEWERYFKTINYRPFDIRNIYYTSTMVDWTRKKLMNNMEKDNIGLYSCRQISGLEWQHVLITNRITDDCYVSNRTKERGYLFPLYTYPDDKKNLFSDLEEEQGKQPNIDPKVFKILEDGLIKESKGVEKITPEKIFYYIYGVLYSNIYREKYVEFLRIDFPRVPFTNDYSLFIEMGKTGQKLADIHLMKSPELNETFSRFEISGDNQVKKVTYKEEEKWVYINDSQYFSHIDRDIWEYQVGGYQVMQKWLKDRKSRSLSLEEIRHYIRISKALQLTLNYQQKIDDLYPAIEEKLIDFKN